MSFPLDNDQRPAVEEHDRHLFLAAGAGSGKTRVLVDRYLKILEVGDWEPSLPARMLAITFTDKAAKQMRDRIFSRLDAASDEAGDPETSRRILNLAREMESAPISTIHGFCSRLLREHALEAGIDPRFRIPDEVALSELRQEVLEGLLRKEDPDLITLAGEFGWQSLTEALESLRELRRSLGLPDDALAGDGAAAEVSRQRETILRLVRAEITEWQALLPASLAALCSHLEGGRHPVAGSQTKIDEALAFLAVSDLTQVNVEIAQGVLDRMKGLRSGGASFPDEGELKAKWNALKGELETYRDRSNGFANAEGGSDEGLAVAGLRLLHRYSTAIAAESRRRGWLDFDDLQLEALRLLESNPELARRCTTFYRHIMVDELQDSNQMQHRLVRCLAPEGGDAAECTLFVVGDHRQSIYAFRNADVEVFKREARMRETKGELARLNYNYRSHPELVRYFNAFFPEDEFPGMRPGLKPDSDEKHPRVLLQITPQSRGEISRTAARYQAAESLAESLRDAWEGGLLVGNGEDRRPMEWGDVAILVRSGAAIAPLARGLAGKNIPFEAAGGREYWLRQELLDLEDLIAALDDPYRRLALARALRGDLIGLATADLLVVLPPASKGDSSTRDGGELLGRLRDGASGKLALSERGRERVALFVTLIDRFAGRLRRLPLRRLVAELVRAADFDLIAAGRPRALKVLRNLRQLEELLAELEGSGRLAVGEWLGYMGRLRDIAPKREEAWVPEEGGSQLRIMTIHAAKGLEFPIVILADIDREIGKQQRLGDLPSLRLDDPSGRAEALLGLRTRRDDDERQDAAYQWIKQEKKRRENAEADRLLYVAMTRAQDYLLFAGVLPDAPAGGAEAARDRIGSGEAGSEYSFLGRLSRSLSEGRTSALMGISIEGEGKLRIAGESTQRAAKTIVAQPPDPAAWRHLLDLPERSEKLEMPVTSLALIESCPLRWLLERRLDAGDLLPETGEARYPDERESGTGPGGRGFGTLLHRILEAWDFHADARDAFEAACPGDLNPRLRKEAERLLVPLFAGDQPWVQRLREGTRFRREEPFLLDLGDVILSGQVDLVFEWQGKDVLIDWKSDKLVSNEQINTRSAQHQLQLALYSLALKEAGRPVNQALLCFLRPGRFRQCDQSPTQLQWYANKARNLAQLARGSSLARPDKLGAPSYPALRPPEPNPPCSDCHWHGNFCPVEYRRSARKR